MSAPRVLVVLDTVSTWSRGVLRGFAKVAHEQGWLLATTDLPLLEVARKSGFTNAALLSVAFRREVGVPPGVYRRRTAGRASDA